MNDSCEVGEEFRQPTERESVKEYFKTFSLKRADHKNFWRVAVMEGTESKHSSWLVMSLYFLKGRSPSDSAHPLSSVSRCHSPVSSLAPP